MHNLTSREDQLAQLMAQNLQAVRRVDETRRRYQQDVEIWGQPDRDIERRRDDAQRAYDLLTERTTRARKTTKGTKMHEISAARATAMANAIMGKPEEVGQELVDKLIADGYEAERAAPGWTPEHVEWTIWDGDEEVTGITCRKPPAPDAPRTAIERMRQAREQS
jgi:hypothetical protein